MKKLNKVILGICTSLLLLSGCSMASANVEFDTADAAKEALNTATEVKWRCDLENIDPSGNFYADGKVAAYMKNSGFLDQTWTFSISDDEWFHMKLVTDQEINDIPKAASTFEFLDKDDNCLGYAQQRVITPKNKEEAYYMVFLDADGNEKDYYASEECERFYDQDGEVIATSSGDIDWTGWQSSIYVSMEEGASQMIDFQDKFIGMFYVHDDLYDYYRDNK